MNPRMISASWVSTTGATLAVLLLATAAWAQSSRIEKHFTVEGKPVVTVDNRPLSGTIQVKTWGKHEVMVVGQYLSGAVEVDAEQAGNRIEVDTRDMSTNPAPGAFKADYEITVPVETELHINTDSGSVTVESVHGNMSFDTVTADLALQDVEGYLEIKSVGGSFICTRCTGQLDATSISGNFQLIQPVMDNVRIHTTSGNILFDGTFLSRGVYVLKDDFGTIAVRFSSNDSFDLNASSLFGKIDSQALVVPNKRLLRTPQSNSSMAKSLVGSVVSDDRRLRTPSMAKSLFGSMEESRAKVELSSFNGIIKIVKRDILKR